MSTEIQKVRNRRIHWALPALCLLSGIGYLIAFSIGGNLQLGLEAFGVMIASGIGLLVFGGRSETIRGLGGADRDERFAMLDLRATAYTALVLIVAILGGFMYEVAKGHSGSPYLWLGVLTGVTYLTCIAVLRFRG